MFVPDFERFDLDLTVELYRQRRALERWRLRGLLAELEEDEMGISPTLRGLGSKLAKFKHDVELDAEKLSIDIDAAATETTATFTGAAKVLDGHRKDLEDVKAFVAEVAQATNGGPPLDTPAPPAAPIATEVTPPPLAAGAPSQTP